MKKLLDYYTSDPLVTIVLSLAFILLVNIGFIASIYILSWLVS